MTNGHSGEDNGAGKPTDSADGPAAADETDLGGRPLSAEDAMDAAPFDAALEAAASQAASQALDFDTASLSGEPAPRVRPRPQPNSSLSANAGAGAPAGPRDRVPALPGYMTREAIQHNSTRLPPHSIESEQAMIGALLIAPESFDQVADVVSEKDFYQFDHRLIFRAILALGAANQPTDVVTVTGWLEQNELLQDAGGLQYIAALAQESPGAVNIKAYAGIVHERAVLRELIAVSNEVADAAYHPEGRASKDLLDFAESKIFSISDESAGNAQGFDNIKSVLAGALDRISHLFETQQAITGLGTGFTELDEQTSGLQSSDLIIIAGRPSMGKTSFAMNIAEHAAISGEHPVAVFSMEMPAEQLAMRMIASLGRIELQKLRSGRLAEQDWPRITSAVSLLNQKRHLFIDDTPALTPTEVRARARRLKREHNGLGLIVIDYLQLMRVQNNAENKATEIAEISRSLKALAKELDVPVIALSQLNRGLEQRPDKRPIMSDLRESGAIEQDADVIMFVYREEVYEPEKEEVKGMAEILIRKQRNGPIGSVKLTFLGANTRFENFHPEMAAARQFQGGSATPPPTTPITKKPDAVQEPAVGVEPANLDDF